SVRLAFRDAQIGTLSTSLHEGRARRRHPDVIPLGLLDALPKHVHDAFVCCIRPVGNQPGEEDDLAIGAMGADLLHEIGHRFRETRRYIRLPEFVWPAPEMPSVHDDIIPNLS